LGFTFVILLSINGLNTIKQKILLKFQAFFSVITVAFWNLPSEESG
jgi:hypothetical protein